MLARVVETLDPAPLLARRVGARMGAPPRIALIGVYLRERMSQTVRLVSQAQSEGIRVALWSVDDPPPELSGVTAGSGPGSRTELLNRAWDSIGSEPWDLVVVVDDDVVFEKRGLRTLIRLTVASGFGLAQPAHARGSWIAHSITARQALRLARETTFVEVGPVFVVARPWVDSVLPLPAGSGMGWGLGITWLRLHDEGCRLGVIDAAPIRHVHAHGRAYDTGPEQERLATALAARGFRSLTEAQRNVASWWAWQSRAPWAKCSH